MASKRKAAERRELSDEELQIVTRALVQRASGLAGSEFRKELGPEYKGYDKRALEAASDLAARREIYRFSSARKVRFFSADPFAALASVVDAALRDGPLEEGELKRRVEASGRGFSDLLTEWLKGALGNGVVHQHAPARGSRKKRFGRDPDLGELFKKVLVELRKVLARPAARRIEGERILALLASELGPTQPSPPPPAGERDAFLRALKTLAAENAADGLLSVRELRSRVGLDKRSFDQLALELSREQIVTLHHHDFPGSLSEDDRRALVEDERGTHYVGIAPRRTR